MNVCVYLINGFIFQRLIILWCFFFFFISVWFEAILSVFNIVLKHYNIIFTLPLYRYDDYMPELDFQRINTDT